MSLLLAALVACTDQERETSRGAALRVELRFPSAGLTATHSPAAIDRIRVFALEMVGDRLVERARAEDEIESGSTHYALALEVPPGDAYLLQVHLEGTRGEGGTGTQEGLLFFGSELVEGLIPGETRSVTIDVVDVVPQLVIERNLGAQYRLSWNAVAGAGRYRLREFLDGAETWSVVMRSTDTTLTRPPRRDSLGQPRSGGGGALATYRVRAELSSTLVGAFSESVGVALAAPVRPDPVQDLRATSVTDSSLILIWTAPADEGAEEPVRSYDLRMSRSVIDESNFEAAGVVPGAPIPNVPGAQEGVFVPSLEADTQYWFALRSTDDAGLISFLSNVYGVTTAGPRDRTPPGTVNTLAARSLSETGVELSWISPGDDGSSGVVDRYEVRFATFELTELNFGSATLATGTPTRTEAGANVTYLLAGLERETSYQVALRAIDEAGNVGALSNIVLIRTEDLTAPAPVTSLAARERTSGSIRLTWLAPGDDGLVGQATRYDLRFATAPISEENFDKAQAVEGIGPPETAGTNETFTVTGLNGNTIYSFALKSFDEAGNGSALSNVVQAQTEAPVPELLSATLVEPRTARIQWVFSGTTPSFRIERAVGTDLFEEIAIVPGTLFQFSDPTLAPATSYSYRVRAEVDEALTAPSNVLTVTTADEPPLCILDPDALDFGLVSLGADSVRTFVVRNGGGGLLEGTAVGSCEDFHILNPQGFALAAGESVGIAVWFTPTQVRDEACALQIGGCGAAVSLRGGGDGPASCLLSTSLLDFEDVPVGSSAERSYEIRNLGGGLLAGRVTLGGCPEFDVAAGADFAIPRLGSHQVTVRFSPTQSGGQACVGFNGADCSQIALLGNGVFCTTTPATLEFGTVPNNQFSTRSLTVQNVSDRRANFSLQEDNGTGCIAFSVGTIDQFFELDAGASRTIEVNFFSQDPGLYTCVLRVRYAFGTGAPTTCTEVPLSATAQ